MLVVFIHTWPARVILPKPEMSGTSMGARWPRVFTALESTGQGQGRDFSAARAAGGPVKTKARATSGASLRSKGHAGEGPSPLANRMGEGAVQALQDGGRPGCAPRAYRIDSRSDFTPFWASGGSFFLLGRTPARGRAAAWGGRPVVDVLGASRPMERGRVPHWKGGRRSQAFCGRPAQGPAIT